MTRSFFIAVTLGWWRSFFDSSPEGFIRRFGTYPSPDKKRKIEVTCRQKSLVDFKVLDAASGKELFKDYVGSDAMRWFLWWETPYKLWGYGSDIGYFKTIDFSAGELKQTCIESGMEVPRQVWDQLPSTMQKRVRPIPK